MLYLKEINHFVETRTEYPNKILNETHFPCNWIFCSHILFMYLVELNFTILRSISIFFHLSCQSKADPLLCPVTSEIVTKLNHLPKLIVLWVLKINTKINCLSVCEYFQSSVLSCIKLIFVTTMKVNKKPGQWTNTFVSTFYSFIHTNLC